MTSTWWWIHRRHDDAIKRKHFRVTGPCKFPAQRPVTRSFRVFFDLHPTKRLSKQSWGWWFETLSRPLWRHSNGLIRNHDNRIDLEVTMSNPVNPVPADGLAPSCTRTSTSIVMIEFAFRINTDRYISKHWRWCFTKDVKQSTIINLLFSQMHCFLDKQGAIFPTQHRVGVCWYPFEIRITTLESSWPG